MLVIVSSKNTKQGHKLKLTYLYAYWIMHMRHPGVSLSFFAGGQWGFWAGHFKFFLWKKVRREDKNSQANWWQVSITGGKFALCPALNEPPADTITATSLPQLLSSILKCGNYGEVGKYRTFDSLSEKWLNFLVKNIWLFFSFLDLIAWN